MPNQIPQPALAAKACFTVAGESGAGKSEWAYEIYRQFNEMGIQAGVLQQVDPYEVKFDFLDSNLCSPKRGESPVYKPLVVF